MEYPRDGMHWSRHQLEFGRGLLMLLSGKEGELRCKGAWVAKYITPYVLEAAWHPAIVVAWKDIGMNVSSLERA